MDGSDHVSMAIGIPRSASGSEKGTADIVLRKCMEGWFGCGPSWTGPTYTASGWPLDGSRRRFCSDYSLLTDTLAKRTSTSPRRHEFV